MYIQLQVTWLNDILNHPSYKELIENNDFFEDAQTT